MKDRPSAQHVAEVKLSPESREAIRYLAHSTAGELASRSKFRAYVKHEPEVLPEHVEVAFDSMFQHVVIQRHRDRWHYGELACTAAATASVNYALVGLASRNWPMVVGSFAILCFAISGFIEIDKRCARTAYERAVEHATP